MAGAKTNETLKVYEVIWVTTKI